VNNCHDFTAQSDLHVCDCLTVGTGRFYFDRDVDCIVTFFEKRFRYVSDKPRPTWEGVLATRQGTLDVIAAASGFIGDREIAEFEKAGGLGERFGDEEGDLEVAAQEEDEDEEDDESEPAVVNQGSGQGGEKIMARDEDVQFKSLRQAEAIALRRLGQDSIGNMYSSQLEPEPEPGPGETGVDRESDAGGGHGVSRLGEQSKVLEIKRAERDKSGHRKVAAEARLERLAQLSGEKTKGDDAEEDSESEDEDTAGLERVDVSHNVAAGKVHFIQPKEIQKQGGEPEEEGGNQAQDSNRPRFARGGGRRAPPKKLTAEEQAALIRKRVSKSKSGRPRNGGGRGGHEGGHGKKSKAKNAGNKNVKAMMQSI
jgi:hypothetical protein